ncbi:GTP 3',8-cyclase MoaA [Ideonella livida]|uniref:GTP 3',8-cyclase n=1 Tax=Ideonella livida TaxID=2707176 RepID=A0A7C9THS0_9BURK|nr:GTP 3',8-cyclase MoaA [Ideonella livida]NDY90618.1 GTP 3',8-cyclase MoaA [Ideonella livida]
MGEKVIAITDWRATSGRSVERVAPVTPTGLLADQLGRPLRDLRISVTDRCNFRCTYCMPKEVFGPDYPFLPQASLLSFEELTRVAQVFLAHGVRKIRLTGGEPLLRKGLEGLISMLAGLRTIDGEAPDLTLTTNGSLLARKATALREAGLRRVTVSLDALDDAVFQRMNDAAFPVARVLEGIEAALAAGLTPLKVNMVVQRGVNDQEIVPMARYFRDHFGNRVSLRFIEYMDVGLTNGWNMASVLPSASVLERLQAHWGLQPLAESAPGETAQRWAYEDGRGEVGLISSVTQAFCQDCNRARLSTEGRLFLCLFAGEGYDLRTLIRQGASQEELAGAIQQVWGQRQDRYSELRGASPAATAAGQPGAARVEMHYIGG